MPIIEKIVKSHFICFGYVWRRPVKAPIRRVNLMEGNPITRDGRRSRKTIDKTVKRVLNINCLNINMIYDKALLHHFIYVTNLT